MKVHLKTSGRNLGHGGFLDPKRQKRTFPLTREILYYSRRSVVQTIFSLNTKTKSDNRSSARKRQGQHRPVNQVKDSN